MTTCWADDIATNCQNAGYLGGTTGETSKEQNMSNLDFFTATHTVPGGCVNLRKKLTRHPAFQLTTATSGAHTCVSTGYTQPGLVGHDSELTPLRT